MKKISTYGACIVLLFSSFTITAQQITNPILAGFYPDPSICRVGGDYYIVNSSFAYYPGLPVFHSTDLVNWQQIGAAMNRPEQLNLDGAGVSRGLFAPTISYHNGLFYIICTLVDKGGNFVITANNPKGPWSNPVWLPEVNGIDPSIFFDDRDKAYITFNSIPPDDKSLYDGHRTIRLFEFDAATLKVTGKEKILINGGTDIAKKPVWIEGPHLYKKDGYYFLLCAEGGTGYNHSEVVFRSKNIEGPYESYANNPILTQRNLDPLRKNPITTTGHADLVETPDGKWYAVFLGCRPYEDDYYNNGRETFMAPVEWKNGWPIINPGKEAIQYTYPMPGKLNKTAEKFSGNYYFKDDFNNSILNNRYSFLRTVRDRWYDLKNKKGALGLQLRPSTCLGNDNPSFIAFRQPHLKGHAAVSINFRAASANEKAGLIIFQNEDHFYYLCKSVENDQPVVQLYKGPGNQHHGKQPELLATQKINGKTDQPVQLKIVANGNTYSFYYSTKKGKWQLLKDKADAKFLSTKEAGGFVGSMYALYATSNGSSSSAMAYYNWFECRNNDDVYKK